MSFTPAVVTCVLEVDVPLVLLAILIGFVGFRENPLKPKTGRTTSLCLAHNDKTTIIICSSTLNMCLCFRRNYARALNTVPPPPLLFARVHVHLHTRQVMEHHPNAVHGDDETAIRRKSLGRLRDMSVAWDVQDHPHPSKYTLNDDTDSGCPSSGRSLASPAADGLVDVELPARKPPNVSAMEMESIRERERAAMLRKCAQHLELESVNGKYTRENFKRGILNKVSFRLYIQVYTYMNKHVRDIR